jgi:AAA15 family ATPase/GTPase
MYKNIYLKNFGIFQKLNWENHQGINIIIGKNDTGKTHLLKLLYSISKTIEDYGKQQQKPESTRKTFQNLLSEKIIWTFQPEGSKGLAEIITKYASTDKKLRVDFQINDENLYFTFGEDTKRQINDTSPHIPLQSLNEINSIFIPAKEVLSAFDAIAATREKLEIFGFDDTYYDLIKALRLPTTRGKVQTEMQEACRTLEELFGGVIRREKEKFIFKKQNRKYTMSQVAEGVKKIGIITILIRNRTIDKHTILFLDEPENNLHPEAILELVRVLFLLNQAGVQIYLTTHSYFVIKQFELLARKHQQNMGVLSLIPTGDNPEIEFSNLREGIPSNPIIDASISLYEQDLKLGED